MKLGFAFILASLALTATAQVPTLPGDWKRLSLPKGDVVTQVYLDEANVTINAVTSDPLRTAVTYHRYDKTKIPGGRATHGLRVAIHDCKRHYVGVVMNVVYSGDELIDRFVGTKEDIFHADSDPVFATEHKGVCSVPVNKLKPTPLNKLSDGKAT